MEGSVSRIHRRKFLVTAGLLLAVPFPSFAQKKKKRIGLLWIKGTEGSDSRIQAFREGLSALGFVDGKDIEIDDRFLVDRYSLLADSAAKLTASQVDVIFCNGSTALAAASRATTAIPIVMMAGIDPVKAGFAESLARPSKNITGVASMINLELGAKRLELLKQAVPSLKIVASPLNSESAREAIGFKDLERTARSLDLELRPIPVRHLDELGAAVKAAAKPGVAAFAPMGSTMFTSDPRVLVNAIAKTGLPAIYVSNDFTRAGGLMSYGPNQIENYRHAATFVAKIFKGAKPGEVPIEQPTTFELMINLEAAKKLGLTIPQELLIRADVVLQ